MKRYGALAIIVALGIGALVVTQMRRVGAPVSPASLFKWLAGTQREITRVPAAATRMSDEKEIEIGNEMAQEYGFRLGGARGSDETKKIQDYVSLIGRRVSGRAHRKLPYQFHYVPESYFVNAFALPGGHVFIGRGLLELMDSEDELAAVLGHEVEHIDHYHCAERAQTEAALRKIPLGGLAAIPVEIFEAGYTKDQELEADREGTQLAVMAGYSPVGAIRMFEKFDQLEHQQASQTRSPGQELSKVAWQSLREYFRSHPPPQERITQVREMIAENHWGNLTSQRDLAVADLLRDIKAGDSSDDSKQSQER
jgi:predicted Zn-dependent protease